MRLNTAATATTRRTKVRTRLLISLSYFCCLWWMFFTFSHCCLMVNGEFYSSVDSLKILGNMEATLIRNYREYLQLQKREMDIVQRFIQDVKFHHKLAKEDVEDYIENPINAFTLIKRMVNDWKDLFEFLKFHDVKLDIHESLTQFEKDFKLPDEKELKGAIRGLQRLQTIYKLSADQMANGENYGKSLNWQDCLEIGTTLLDDGHFHQVIDWLELSLLKLQASKESNDVKSFYTKHIKEYLSLTYQSIGESELAVEYLDDILDKDPDNNAKITRHLLLNAESEMNVKSEPSTESETSYARLCRGERLHKFQQLNCRLDSKVHPFFTLSPLQIEPLLLNPPVILYHNLLNDAQIAQLLSETQNKLERSSVVNGTGRIILESRVSQQTWLNPKTSVIVGKMYKLVNVISGLNMTNAEIMQVANYGIGGQYDPHYDYLGDEYKSNYVGDRISTNMFYLSEVEEGGYTVFPYLDIYSKPVKGAMIMWYNLHKSLRQDERTLHAGCPVLRGSKKIANIWTHSGYQEFRKPCGLANDNKIN